jgi:hypothetical protein
MTPDITQTCSGPGGRRDRPDEAPRAAGRRGSVRRRRVPGDSVMRETKHRILDTFGAMISGAHLKPVEMFI